jgi:ribulose-bisphosphate carboxylase large chain
MVDKVKDWYLDFVDLEYKPSKKDFICLFRVEPVKGISMKEAAGRVASESSVGTWTTLFELPNRVKDLMARVYEIKGNFIKVAYPIELFESGNLPQILSSIAGNVFGMKAVKNLRLEDVKIPKELLKSFKGPQFGIEGLRKAFRIKERPLTATVPKPKLGFNLNEYAKVAYQIWKSGIDFVKNDENLTSQKFIPFYKTVEKILKIKENVEKESGDKKMYLANVSAETKEMEKRIKFVAENGGEIVMVDGLTIGFAALQTVREICEDLNLALYMHRAFHAAFTRNKKHGVSMLVISTLARMVGVDALHIGGMGKLVSPKQEVFALKENLTKNEIERNGLLIEWYDVKQIFPVCSGGLHPGIIPKLIKFLGKDLIIQVGGGVMGHPLGIEAGGKAVLQAIDATLKGISLEKAAEKHFELKKALEKWGKITPI